MGLGAALAVGTSLPADVALGCLAVALLLQIAANLANDLSDFRKGADTPDRQGPVRVAAAGLVTARQLEVAIASRSCLAGLVGLYLTFVGGRVLLALGGLAIVAALAYTGGPWPYGYAGSARSSSSCSSVSSPWSGPRTSRRADWSRCSSWPSVARGLADDAILVVNNLRDIPTDAAAGKRTLAVILRRALRRMSSHCCCSSRTWCPSL